MAERATILQRVQIGAESTPGTEVNADKRLSSLQIVPAIDADIQKFRAMGFLVTNVAAMGKEFTTAALSGVPTYNELPYIFSSLLKDVAPTLNDTTSYTWLYEPSASDEDTVQTYTVEVGGAVRAMLFTYGLITGATITFSRNGLEISGAMIGQQTQDGITMTATPTLISLVPVLAKQGDIFIDTAAAGLGGTQLDRAFKGELTFSDRFAGVWPIKSANASFAAHVVTEPTIQLKLTVAADATGMGLLTQARAGDTRFIRCEWTGANIETTYDYLFRVDFAGKITEIGEWEDEDGVYAITYTWDATYDATWAKFCSIRIVNTLASL
jgi:hypothetical protein